jgi:hypothetical protein
MSFLKGFHVVVIGWVFVAGLDQTPLNASTSHDAKKDAETGEALAPDINAVQVGKRRFWTKFNRETKQYIMRECDPLSIPKKIEDCDQKTEVKISQEIFELVLQKNIDLLNPSIISLTEAELAILKNPPNKSFSDSLEADIKVAQQNLKNLGELKAEAGNDKAAVKKIETDIANTEKVIAALKQRLKSDTDYNTSYEKVKKKYMEGESKAINEQTKAFEDIKTEIQNPSVAHKLQFIPFQTGTEYKNNPQQRKDNALYSSLELMIDNPQIRCGQVKDLSFFSQEYALHLESKENVEKLVKDCADVYLREGIPNRESPKWSRVGFGLWNNALTDIKRDNVTGLVWASPSIGNVGLITSRTSCQKPFRLPTEEEMKTAATNDLLEAFPEFNSRWKIWVDNPEEAIQKQLNQVNPDVRFFMIQRNARKENGQPDYVKKVASGKRLNSTADILCVLSPK